jgi:lysophospholipase L1-like esterase
MKKTLSFLLVFILAVSTLISCGEDEDFAAQVAAYRAEKIAMYESENAQYGDYEVDIAFLGDSLTDGYDVKKYYPQYLVSNRGIGGETTIGLEERMQVSLYDLKPKVAVMLIGANNMDTMFDNYESILLGFQENMPNTKIVLLSLTSMSGEWGKKNQLAAYNNVKIKMLAEKYGYEYVDLYSALLNLDSGEIYPEYTTDGGHLTAEGYEVLTAKITPAIERQIAAWNAENQ